ncbi:hypothetical protein LIC_13277 [Leptospira interrogans serovar Copenhageni str. Fiocruz L1-130]|uniref:Uncharacterized protein n=1 Tax=Leptospira interrogans serogroup Icterohaemorrhagiae serovar copenhageni (strain Fiocruz L1-130) TaxID=267671 RepID=Q72MB1_LEPIC|nr:hypothetical protein LIC_13277 [Leptospira interrogans serovar Copenhageni str. Fiocruz L1-130]
MEIFFQSFLKHFDFFRKKLTQLENESFKKNHYQSFRIFLAAVLIEFLSFVLFPEVSLAIISIVFTNSSAARSNISESRISFFVIEEFTEPLLFLDVVF